MKHIFLFITVFFASGLMATENDPVERLKRIHFQLTMLHGNLLEEYPEQLMTTMFLPEDAKVLELGGNVGRNSCVIAKILHDDRNLVTLESDPKIAKLLQENRDFNHLHFHIEPSALSKVKLIQSGWKTKPSKKLLPGFKRVNTLTFSQLQEKYDIEFDTLVADCEGAMYYILRDDPAVLKNMKLVIMENDFHEISHFNFVQEQFIRNGLQLVYNRAGGWKPCYDHFFQVWKK